MSNNSKPSSAITVLSVKNGEVVEFDIPNNKIRFPKEKDFREVKKEDYSRVMENLEGCSLQSMLDFEYCLSKKFGKLPDIDVAEFLVTRRKAHKLT